jgi:hypothetical protein
MHHRIHKATYKTNQRTKRHDGNTPHGIGQFARKWARKTCGKCENGNDKPNVLFASHIAQKIGQFGNHHLERSRKQEITGTKQPKLGGEDRSTFLHQQRYTIINFQ